MLASAPFNAGPSNSGSAVWLGEEGGEVLDAQPVSRRAACAGLRPLLSTMLEKTVRVIDRSWSIWTLASFVQSANQTRHAGTGIVRARSHGLSGIHRRLACNHAKARPTSDLVLSKHAVLGKHGVLVDALHMPVPGNARSAFAFSAAPECLA